MVHSKFANRRRMLVGTSARRGRADYEGKGKGKEISPSQPRKKVRRGGIFSEEWLGLEET